MNAILDSRLLALARQLVGERLQFVRRSYPDSLKLHFGTLRETPGPRGTVLPRGAYVLGSAGADWSLKLAREGVLVASGESAGDSPIGEDEIDRRLVTLGGEAVVGVEIDPRAAGFALSLTLADGSHLTLTPSPAETDAPDVPDCELFTPYGRYLVAGPGARWAYLPSA